VPSILEEVFGFKKVKYSLRPLPKRTISHMHENNSNVTSVYKIEPYTDDVWSAAANRVYRFGGDDAPISFCQRRRVLFTGGAALRVGIIVPGSKYMS